VEVVRVESGPSDTQGRIAATADADADSSDLENKKKYVNKTQKGPRCDNHGMTLFAFLTIFDNI